MHANQLSDCREILITYASVAGVVLFAFFSMAAVSVLNHVAGTLT